MKNKMKSLRKMVVTVISMMVLALAPSLGAFADGYGLTVTPMNQEMVLVPGDTYEASFKLSNPSSQTEDVYYDLSIEPFYIMDDGTIAYESQNGSGDIVNWVSFKVPTEGKLSPNEVTTVVFEIKVPNDAPAGGQYVSIVATMMNKTEKEQKDENSEENGDVPQMTIKEIRRIAHLFYAEIEGNSFKTGEILSANVPSFLLSGNITASSSIKNTGNVHGKAYYKMQVFPLFSSEEVYTNEEDPETHTILPDQTLYSESVWDKTPGIGIFNVVYSVEFAGSTAKVERLVIICPLWLLFIILFAVAALIIWILFNVSKRKRS